MSLSQLNEKLFWIFNGHPSLAGDYIMYALSFSAYTFSAIIVALLALHFYKGFSKRNLFILAVALIVGGAVVHVVKQNYPAYRPLAYFDEKNSPSGMRVHAPFERHGHMTFPSGHSQTAFTVATFITLLFRRHFIAWFAWAVLVAVSRVYLGVHFPLDVLGGAAIGAVITFITMKIGAKYFAAK